MLDCDWSSDVCSSDLSAKLKPLTPGCAALLLPKLGKGALGKPAKFTFTFAGNGALAPFAKKKTLTIAVPVNTTPIPPAPTGAPYPPNNAPVVNGPAPAPTDPTTPTNTSPTGPPISSTPVLTFSTGTWASESSTPLGNVFKWTVPQDGSTFGVTISGGFRWKCGDDIRFANFHFYGGLTAQPNGAVTGSYHYGSGLTSIDYSANFMLSGNTMTGAITASGSYEYSPGSASPCGTTESFTGYHYGP
jgi:hypothetical protein